MSILEQARKLGQFETLPEGIRVMAQEGVKSNYLESGVLLLDRFIVYPEETGDQQAEREEFERVLRAGFAKDAEIIQSSEPVNPPLEPGRIDHTAHVEVDGNTFKVSGPIEGGKFAGSFEYLNVDWAAKKEDEKFQRYVRENGPDF